MSLLRRLEQTGFVQLANTGLGKCADRYYGEPSSHFLKDPAEMAQLAVYHQKCLRFIKSVPNIPDANDGCFDVAHLGPLNGCNILG